MIRPIDFHLHFGPDERPRKYDGHRIVADYLAIGARGVVYKSHQLGTSVGAALLNHRQDGFRVAGGVALNAGVGGLNPAAVEASARSGGRVVWLPTHDCTAILAAIPDTGELLRQVRPVLEACAQYDQVLCSGHLPLGATVAVFALARELGVERRVVNHPDHVEVDMPVHVQADLAKEGAYMERVIPRPRNTAVDLAGLFAQMQAVGLDRNVLGSDLGQPDSEDPAEGYSKFLQELAGEGLTEGHLATVAEHNAAALLGWEELS
jgi:hypothetical protein